MNKVQEAVWNHLMSGSQDRKDGLKILVERSFFSRSSTDEESLNELNDHLATIAFDDFCRGGKERVVAAAEKAIEPKTVTKIYTIKVTTDSNVEKLKAGDFGLGRAIAAELCIDGVGFNPGGDGGTYLTWPFNILGVEVLNEDGYHIGRSTQEHESERYRKNGHQVKSEKKAR